MTRTSQDRADQPRTEPVRFRRPPLADYADEVASALLVITNNGW
jgi:hypothetical protein